MFRTHEASGIIMGSRRKWSVSKLSIRLYIISFRFNEAFNIDIAMTLCQFSYRACVIVSQFVVLVCCKEENFRRWLSDGARPMATVVH